LDDFFQEFGTERSSKLPFVCTDLWKPYLQVVTKKAGQALNILDRFHIMSHMNKAIDKVRATEARTLKAKGNEPVLAGSRWCFLKRPENCTGYVKDSGKKHRESSLMPGFKIRWT
jgi:transposase